MIDGNADVIYASYRSEIPIHRIPENFQIPLLRTGSYGLSLLRTACQHCLRFYVELYQVRTSGRRGGLRKGKPQLVDEYGTVIDITGDQFAGKLLPEKDVDMVYVGPEGPVQKIFCKDRKPEGNTNFTDPKQFDPLTGRPNKRQQTLIDVDRIVRHYLEK